MSILKYKITSVMSKICISLKTNNMDGNYSKLLFNKIILNYCLGIYRLIKCLACLSLFIYLSNLSR